MGFFSWITSDTNRSISNVYSSRKAFKVAVIFPDNSRVIEDKYEGYGVFDGVDVYEWIAKANGKKTREEGIDLVSDDFEEAAKNGFKVPKFAENLDAKYENLLYPKSCPDQGYFYEDENKNEDEDENE